MSVSLNATPEDLIRAFNTLSDNDKLHFIELFRQAVPQIWPIVLNSFPTGRIHEVMDRTVRPQIEEIRKRDKEARDRKPSSEIKKRNIEIVRLRDVEKKTFGAIPRLLKEKNPLWVGKEGKILERDAVEKAYIRTKKSRH